MAPPQSEIRNESANSPASDVEKTPANTSASEVETKLGDEDAHKQEGVRQVEAITSAWSFKALVLTYVFIYICSYTHSMQQQLDTSLTPYVTSSFRQHGLTATTTVLASIVSGVSRLAIAKILNIWGRMEGFFLMNMLCALGLMLMALCKNVETFAAAQVFYTVGSAGIGYVVTIFIADTTSLRNRTIIFGLNSTAYIGNAFAGPAVAQLFYKHSSFRWAFGSFAIIVPVIALPVCFMFWWNYRKAKHMGLVEEKREGSGRTWKESIIYYCREFDVVGMLLAIAGFALLLLPLSLAARSLHRWRSAHIIAMLVLGVVLLAAFAAWERLCAPVPFLPWRHLRDRTVLGACALTGVMFISSQAWGVYFSSYLQVVHRLSIRDAGYILNIYNVASCFWGPIVGLMIRYTGRFKWIGLCAVPLACLATALLIHFRHPGTPIGLIAMTQIFKAFAGGTLVLCEEMAVMASVGHNEVAVVIALLGLFSSIGGSIGRSISGSIWTNQLPVYLERYLPDEEKKNVMKIYGSLPTQLSYEWGSPVREAIVHAYGDVQRKMVIVGAAFMPLALACVLLWRNINVKNLHQTKGQVF